MYDVKGLPSIVMSTRLADSFGTICTRGAWAAATTAHAATKATVAGTRTVLFTVSPLTQGSDLDFPFFSKQLAKSSYASVMRLKKNGKSRSDPILSTFLECT